MTEPDIFESLPQDPEHAFLLLEREFRLECEERVRQANQDDNTTAFYVDYIAQVIAAIDELGLDAEFEMKIPDIQDLDYNAYLNFSKNVKHLRTALQIRHGRRVQGYSVQFNAATRAKVQHHIQQLRELFEKLELETAKKEVLFDKLNALQQEVDRERTRFDAYAALVVEAAGVVGDAVEKSRVLEVINAIGRAIWGSKQEEIKRLPPPKPPRRLEHKKKPQKRDLDDDIPF